MTTTKDAAQKFLSSRRIAVTGVSHAPKGHGSNAVYCRLRERGYDVVAVSPNAAQVEGDPTFPDLTSIPGDLDAVVIGTRPERAMATMEQAVARGVPRVWMHRAFGAGSVSPEAAAYGREHGIEVIDGGCPLMFGATSDGAHRVMCHLLTWTGAVPRQVS
jgi:predicted CoA-binding protein